MVAAWAVALSATPVLFPCNEVSRSSNGRFVVTQDFSVEPGPARAHFFQQITLRVLPNNERYVHPPNLLTVPARDPVDSLPWRVVLDAREALRGWGCGTALVTNDGQYIVIPNMGWWVEPMSPALRVYRRPRKNIQQESGADGVLVRTIMLREIWHGDKLALGQTGWWQGGNFDLSADSRTLIHTTRWGNTVRIKLRNGSVHNLYASDATRRP